MLLPLPDLTVLADITESTRITLAFPLSNWHVLTDHSNLYHRYTDGDRSSSQELLQTAGARFLTGRMPFLSPNQHYHSTKEMDIINGVGTNFGVGVGEARPKGPRAGDGVLGEVTPSPSPPTRGFAGAL